ncbi:hypothetical protein B7P43_G03266 [Cryptotermes secundus]|nr:hypothetical protein B7P43_G03266 [Cryptotermes secundus]
MVEYCEQVKCRHGIFADYFGDKSPPCKAQKQCDVCRNPGNVEKSIEEFYRHISKGTNSLTLTEDGSDLYGGGRKGQKIEAERYKAEGKERDGNKTKNDLQFLIQKQFCLRRKSSHQENEDTSAKYSRVRAADVTGVKVNGLTISARESYLSLLVENLNKNYERSHIVDPGQHCLSTTDIEMCAIDMEYEAFTSNKVASLYRRLLAKMMAEIKRNTDVMTLNQRLKEFKPRGNLSLHDAVAQVKSSLKNGNGNSNEPLGTVPSSQLHDIHSCTQVPNNVATKNKIYPRRMSSLNRDSLSQQLLESYFKKAESGCSEIDSERSTEHSSTVTDYRESDGTSNISSSESSIRNVPFMEDDVNSSDSAQEFDCEEYDEEEILNSDNEIEISQQECNETLGETADNKTVVMYEITVQHNEHLNKTVVKTEGVHIKQEQDSDEYFDRQDMTTDLSKVKTENSCITPGEGSDMSLGSQFYNCRVKEENSDNSHILPVERTNCRIETVTQNSNEQTARKRKLSQDLFGDPSDEEMFLDSEPDDWNCSNSNKLSQKKPAVSLNSGRDVKRNKIHTNKMDKMSLPLKNTDNNCNIKKVCQEQEVTFKSVNKSPRCNVQNMSENVKDKQQEMQSSGNYITKVNRQTVADTVVKHLMPFYKEKRIASRDLFKLLARQLAHHLLEHYSTDERTVKKFVDGFFKSHKTVSTESDVCISPEK